MAATELVAPDYIATFDGHSRLELRPRLKWLTTSALIIVAVLLVGAGIYSLAAGLRSTGGTWAACGLAAVAGVVVALRLHRAKHEFFVLDLATGAHSVEYYYASRDERRARIDELRRHDTPAVVGDIDVSISTTAGFRTVDGAFASVSIHLLTNDPERPRRFMYTLHTVDRRAAALKSFLESAMRDLARNLPDDAASHR